MDETTKDMVEIPFVTEPTEDELADTQLVRLSPKQQRFVHMYLSGQYTLKQIADLMNMSLSGIRKYLGNADVKHTIEVVQGEEDDIVRQVLKATRLKALYKMGDLLNSKVEGIAYQAARDILDRTGHKAPTKNETKVEIYTFEQQLRDVIEQAHKPEQFVDVDYVEVDKK